MWNEQRFWSKIRIGSLNECWEWQASCNGGYGNFKLNGKVMGAHRVAWELTNGPIPEGQQVLHTCDNRKCCNPDHLFLGTQHDNSVDMVNKGRCKPPGLLGEQHGRVKLTETQVIEIRRLYSAKTHTQYQLADLFGIKQPNISDIVNRKIWTHI